MLARHFRVILALPNPPDLEAEEVELWPYKWQDWPSLAGAVRRADVLLAGGDVLDCFPQLQALPIPLVVDGYDPHTVETLALFDGTPQQDALHRKREEILRLQCILGDFFLCASERQRDWWLGLLEAAGRINSHTYRDDPSLRRLVDLVPFGLRSTPLRHTQAILRGVWPGIGQDDQIILWGGGLWQWMDPLSAVRAMSLVCRKRQDARLVFPGTRHPNPAIPDMQVQSEARELAESMGLVHRVVFFGDWVAYEQWPNVLAESTVALSLHLDSVETRLAFRSRVLDYVWAGLPIVATRGDATSELVLHHGLGQVVGYQDVDAIGAALLQLLESPASYSAAFARARDALTWERAAQPLVEFCRAPHFAADKHTGTQGQAQQALHSGDLQPCRSATRSASSMTSRFLAHFRRVRGVQE